MVYAGSREGRRLPVADVCKQGVGFLGTCALRCVERWLPGLVIPWGMAWGPRTRPRPVTSMAPLKCGRNTGRVDSPR